MDKILIVGAGLSGAVIARELAEAGYNVTVIDKRNHIAGNCYDYTNEHGIRVHRYGPHIFHTNSEQVVEWIFKYGEWIEYYHKVKAILANGQYVTLPVNKETKAIVGEENVLDIFFRPYNKKMWNKTLEEMDPTILQRVPIRDDMNELYFPNDKYQYLPKEGYTKFFENVFLHKNITVKVNTVYDKAMNEQYDFVFNSMPIDEYFDFCHGELPYRSMKFHDVHIPVPRLLPTAAINLTNDGPYTRVSEWKNLPKHGVNPVFTTLTYEEPCDYKDNNMERYYPVKDLDGANREVYKLYRAMTPNNMKFIGRCGQYVYIDMHQAISNSLAIVDKFVNKLAKE
jgi:UDP-galactopyranose mutase